MAKAILVMDMPKSCERCRLHSFWGNDLDVLCKMEGKAQSFEDACKGRPSWCPVREVPEKKEAQKINPYEMNKIEYNKGYRQGYNKCIDEILGKDDEKC